MMLSLMMRMIVIMTMLIRMMMLSVLMRIIAIMTLMIMVMIVMTRIKRSRNCECTWKGCGWPSE